MKLTEALASATVAPDIYDNDVPLVGVLTADTATDRVRIYPVPGNRSVYISVPRESIAEDVHLLEGAEAGSRGFVERVVQVRIRADVDVKVVSVRHISARELFASGDVSAQQSCGPYCCPNGVCAGCTGPNCRGGCSNGKDPWANCT